MIRRCGQFPILESITAGPTPATSPADVAGVHPPPAMGNFSSAILGPIIIPWALLLAVVIRVVARIAATDRPV
jgi:hypothetical protein